MSRPSPGTPPRAPVDVGPATAARDAVPLAGCGQPLATAYDVALLDLDGVVYLGGSPIPGASDALVAAGHQGMRLAFVTNNASRTPAAIAAQLAGWGIPARPSDVVTSAQAAAHLLADRLPPGSPVLVVGGMGLRTAVRERGLRPVTDARCGPAAVVQGYAPDLSYHILAEAALAVRAGAWYVASNADLTLPTPRGRQPGNGSLLQVIITSTGTQPVVAGKPEPPLHTEAVTRTGARRPLVVGDRLDTDVESATRTGTDSLLVFTGVTDPVDAVLAGERHRPSYLADDLGGLLVPHPAVTRETAETPGAVFRCGGWHVCWDGNGLAAAGSGDRMDGLRAVCAAAWWAGGVTASQSAAAPAQRGVTPKSAADAVACLGF